MSVLVKLKTYGCLQCGEQVKVPMTLPYKGDEKPTGMTIDYYDESGYSHILGALCFQCADKLCIEGVVCLGYAGFPHSWDATLMDREHVFPYEEKHRIKCGCDQCLEEEYGYGWDEDYKL